MALAICIALMAAGCSGTEKAAMAGDAETNDIEEKTEEYTEEIEDVEDTSVAEPGVYAEFRQNDGTIEIIPIEGGITDSTVLPTFTCTFGDIIYGAQNSHEEERIFAKECCRDRPACMLVSEEFMAGKEHDAIVYSLSNLAAMANEFGSLEPVLNDVVYETGEDGRVTKSFYNVYFGSADKDGQIIYDNRARKWYVGDTEYSGSMDDEDTIAVWWTVFEHADGKEQE